MAKVLKGQMPMFEPRADTGVWKPPSELPDLRREKRLWVDCTTTGNDKRKDVPVGLAVSTLDKSWFVPFGFEGGGNLDPEACRRWAKDNFHGKSIRNLNTGFDAEAMRNWGCDLEELGCTLHDVAHTAALLNENRYGNEFSLKNLGEEYVGRGKVDCPVHASNHHKCHSSLIAEYEMGDSALARDIDIAQRPLVAEDELERVEALEDELIWANNHMERSGFRLDMPLLEAWRAESTGEYSDLTMKIWSDTGVKLSPDRVNTWGMLFDRLGLARHKTGEVKTSKKGMLSDVESYTEEFLHGVDDPLVRDGLRMRRIKSLKSKYLDKYWNAQKKGVLYFNLYQLRASEEDYGTVVGRYSSANVNIQQVYKVGNQLERTCDCGCPKNDREKLAAHRPDCFGAKYVIRRLMLCDEGNDLFAGDGSQLQFRLFAHYSKDPILIGKYRDDPDVDFHRMVAELFHLTRQAAKHNNFAMVLGMGREKLAIRIGLACKCRDASWWSRATRGGMSVEEAAEHFFGDNKNHAASCPARESNDMADDYEDKFPAAKKLMREITKTAEERGYIRTLLGRRRRYHEGDKFYSAFAGLLQGSEADLVKTKINTLYRERKTIGIEKLRCPVHDEIVGDVHKEPTAHKRLEEAYAVQEIPLKVPLIWNVGYGKNWMETK